jgi:hypothetical protein
MDARPHAAADPAKRAYQDIDIRQHHVRRMSRRTASISAASPISCKSLELDTGQQPAACLVNQWQDAFGLRRLAVIGNEYSQPPCDQGYQGAALGGCIALGTVQKLLRQSNGCWLGTYHHSDNMLVCPARFIFGWALSEPIGSP